MADRDRRSYAAAVGELLVAGFGQLPSFAAPHYSVVLGSYIVKQAELLIRALGEMRRAGEQRARAPMPRRLHVKTLTPPGPTRNPTMIRTSP